RLEPCSFFQELSGFARALDLFGLGRTDRSQDKRAGWSDAPARDSLLLSEAGAQRDKCRGARDEQEASNTQRDEGFHGSTLSETRTRTAVAFATADAPEPPGNARPIPRFLPKRVASALLAFDRVAEGT